MLNIILMFATFNLLNKKKSVFSFIVNLKKMYYATKESIKFFHTLPVGGINSLKNVRK